MLVSYDFLMILYDFLMISTGNDMSGAGMHSGIECGWNEIIPTPRSQGTKIYEGRREKKRNSELRKRAFFHKRLLSNSYFAHH
jgi:hypothetical protein